MSSQPTNTPVILLVDDEPDLLDICREALDGGFDVRTARNGLEALAVLTRDPVDLVISDLRMPHMGGMDLLARIGEMDVDTDVIVLTGYGTVENAVECVQMGAANYLLKPFRIEQLLAAVTKALSERDLRRQQNRVGNLARMIAFSDALTGQEDMRSVLKEFLGQVRDTFSPDGIALFLDGETGRDLGRYLLIGPYFKENPPARRWFEQFAQHLVVRGRPVLLDKTLLAQAFGSCGTACALPGSAMGAAVTGGGRPAGVVVSLRTDKHLAYTLSDLQLFTLFSSHAAMCFESHRACRKLRDVNREMVYSYVSAVEAKDRYTRGHSERVSALASLTGQGLGLPRRDLELLRTAGMLHDIGKIGVPDHILNKPGALTGDELAVMRRHAAVGRDILSKVKSLEDVVPIIYHHHERVDGRGYPDGLAGDAIPRLARVVSVVDGFEAMTSDRAYHKARSLGEALAILQAGAGTQWDPDAVAVLASLVEKDPAALRPLSRTVDA